MLSSLTPPLVVAILLSFTLETSAVPQAETSRSGGLTIPIKKRAPSPRTSDEWGVWAKSQREGLEAKYGNPGKTRRATGTNLLTNQNADSSYFGSLAIGTPPAAFNVILDTGSADLWLADSECQTGCESVPTFNPSSSSSYKNQSTAFSITYGSGQAAGFLGKDIVQMAGFSVENQVFAVCDQVSSGLLNDPVSGLLGLAFKSIASSGAQPFWETLVTNNAWDSPLMSFQLTRFLNESSAQTEEFGGSFSMGFANSSLYIGEIDYVDMPVEGSYWILPMTELTVQGNSVSLPTGQGAYAAIDTGTTLIGGPSEYISAIFEQIPGSQAGTGNFQNYYTYPCDTTVNVTLSFGGSRSWTISPADFRLSRLTRTSCLGAFFELSTGSSAPSWIVGDTFLKNVYSVFRYSPLSIGFAELSATAVANNAADIAVPSATIGSATTVSATAGSSQSGSSRSGAISLRSRSASASRFINAGALVVPLAGYGASSLIGRL
ncbi:aspartic peptidase A1 [Pholiota conissans]|uniref:Aspartic peptidase A1 n=1 Tax=Pholiota conissans TaxID=109636 RepID=A0A9P6D412_9AGAR|nr:aspartic peptidase A1 [Pholiota conissans]